jgi:hypothetical protein
MPLNKQILATLSASSERFIGTQGGGMDQAIAFFAKKGYAQYIEFGPVRATPIKLPEDAVFVIANSLTEANKAATSDFNQRVVECRIATKLLAKLSDRPWQDVEKLGHLQSEVLDIELDEFETLIKKHLTKDIYTKQELIGIFHISQSDFEEKMLTPNTKHAKEFKLRQRALHVVQGTCLFILSYRAWYLQTTSYLFIARSLTCFRVPTRRTLQRDCERHRRGRRGRRSGANIGIALQIAQQLELSVRVQSRKSRPAHQHFERIRCQRETDRCWLGRMHRRVVRFNIEL